MKKTIVTVLLIYLGYYLFQILKDMFFTKEKIKTEDGERYSFENRGEPKKITEDSLKETIRKENDNPTEEEFEELFYSPDLVEEWESIGDGIDLDSQKFAEEERLEEIKEEALKANEKKINKELENINNKTISETDTHHEETKITEFTKKTINKFINSYDKIDVQNEGYEINSLVSQLN